MKKLPIIFLSAALVLALAGVIIVHQVQNRTHFNTYYVNGNTAGNLYNAGLFCESNGTVFFSNPDDGGSLYSMDSNGSNLKKLCNDNAMYINADDHYVYYVRNNTAVSASGDTIFSYFSYNNNSLCRLDRKNGKIKVLDADPCIYASLIGNYIYYLHYDTETATTLYKIKIDGSERTKLSDTYVFTCSSDGQYFYYNDMTTNGYIHRYDTATDTDTTVYACNSYKPIVTDGDNAYYLDVSRNNALMHTNLNSETPTMLSSDSIDLYNVHGSYAYYQTYDSASPALCMIKNDGTGERVLMEGTFSCINVTSYYIYCTDYHTGMVFRTPTSNPGEFEPFHPGIIE